MIVDGASLKVGLDVRRIANREDRDGTRDESREEPRGCDLVDDRSTRDDERLACAQGVPDADEASDADEDHVVDRGRAAQDVKGDPDVAEGVGEWPEACDGEREREMQAAPPASQQTARERERRC